MSGVGTQGCGAGFDIGAGQIWNQDTYCRSLEVVLIVLLRAVLVIVLVVLLLVGLV